MTVASADYATVVVALQRCLAHGTQLDGVELRLALDVIQDAANTLDSQASATAVALEALLVTHMAAWDDAGVGDSSAAYTAALAALAAPRADAVAAAAGSITDILVNDIMDGR